MECEFRPRNEVIESFRTLQTLKKSCSNVARLHLASVAASARRVLEASDELVGLTPRRSPFSSVGQASPAECDRNFE